VLTVGVAGGVWGEASIDTLRTTTDVAPASIRQGTCIHDFMMTAVLCNGMDWRCAATAALIIPVVAQVSEIPLDRLKPDATITVELAAQTEDSADALWVPVRNASAVIRVDARNSTADKPLTLDHPPCASVMLPEDVLWTAACDGASLSRVDLKHRNVSAPMPLPIARPEGGIAFAGRSLWAITDAKGIVTRIDPETRTAVAEVYVAPKPFAVAAGDDAVWITSEEGDVVTRLDAQTNVVTETIKVGARPGPLAVGEGAVWVLNRGDGSVSRVEAKSNKVVQTIAIGESVAGGVITTGEGAVWISARGVPLVRIDPRTNRVTHRFRGEGGGAIVVAHGSVWVNVAPNTTWRLDPKLVAAMRPE
jgi:virginiamycin B lyase